MLELKLAQGNLLEMAYRRDLEAAFPAAELKPFGEICAELRRGEYRAWCLFDGEALVGEAFVWSCTPGFALFDYLCVTASRRNGGLGAKLVEKLVEAERGNVLFGEAEIAAFAPEPKLAERRLAFYARCGARRAGYDSCVFGVPYHTLYWAEEPVPDETLRAAHEAAYHSCFAPKAYRRYITIPWEPSMGLPKKTAWLGQKKA